MTQLEAPGHAVVMTVSAVTFVVPPAQSSIFESLPPLFFLAVFRTVFDCLGVGFVLRDRGGAGGDDGGRIMGGPPGCEGDPAAG